MASVKTNFAVGLFIITGIAVVAVVVIYVGASTYLKPGRLYSAFFNESVQGLSKDSPVKYRGVPVGQVHDIRIAEDGRLVEVVLRIDSDWKPDENTIAQLKAIGITGIMFVELDIREASDQVLKPDLQSFSENPVIPTTTSDIRQLLSGVSDVVKQMKAIDLKGISRQVRQTVKDIDTSFKHAEIKKISERLQSAIDKANHILNTRQWDEIINSVAGTSHDLNNFAEKANRTTGHLDSLITENEDKLTEAISLSSFSVIRLSR